MSETRNPWNLFSDLAERLNVLDPKLANVTTIRHDVTCTSLKETFRMMRALERLNISYTVDATQFEEWVISYYPSGELFPPPEPAE